MKLVISRFFRIACALLSWAAMAIIATDVISGKALDLPSIVLLILWGLYSCVDYTLKVMADFAA